MPPLPWAVLPEQICRRCCPNLWTWPSPHEFSSGQGCSPSWVAGQQAACAGVSSNHSLCECTLLTGSLQSTRDTHQALEYLLPNDAVDWLLRVIGRVCCPCCKFPHVCAIGLGCVRVSRGAWCDICWWAADAVSCGQLSRILARTCGCHSAVLLDVSVSARSCPADCDTWVGGKSLNHIFGVGAGTRIARTSSRCSTTGCCTPSPPRSATSTFSSASTLCYR